MELEANVPNRYGKRAGNLVAVMHSEAFEMENVDVELGYVMNVSVMKPFELPSGRVLTLTELPAVAKYGTKRQKGASWKLPMTAARLSCLSMVLLALVQEKTVNLVSLSLACQGVTQPESS